MAVLPMTSVLEGNVGGGAHALLTRRSHTA